MLVQLMTGKPTSLRYTAMDGLHSHLGGKHDDALMLRYSGCYKENSSYSLITQKLQGVFVCTVPLCVLKGAFE